LTQKELEKAKKDSSVKLDMLKKLEDENKRVLAEGYEERVEELEK